MVTLLKSTVAAVAVKLFPLASSVVIFPPNEILVAPVKAIVLILPLAPIVHLL